MVVKIEVDKYIEFLGIICIETMLRAKHFDIVIRSSIRCLSLDLNKITKKFYIVSRITYAFLGFLLEHIVCHFFEL